MLTFQDIADKQVITKLQAGAVGVAPTDTVYGLVARAADTQAVTRLYALKSRERKPGTIIAAHVEQVIELGLKARYVKAVEQYWPNPLSVVIPCGPELDYLSQGTRSLAVRIPANKAVRDLLAQTGALVTSSANAPGEPTARDLAEAQAYFGEQVDFYVDGGTVADPVPSTVIRVIDDAVEVLRVGAVNIDKNGRITT